jgi:hypothetical protein
MFNAAGGSNTPRIGEGYYHVPLCGALAHKFFGLLAKAEDTFVKKKSKEPSDHQPPLIKRSRAGVTLSISTHKEIENKCLIASPERAAHRHPKLFRNISKASSETSTLTYEGKAFAAEVLTKSHSFGSSGLNLTFEGLLLGASLHTIAEGVTPTFYKNKILPT